MYDGFDCSSSPSRYQGGRGKDHSFRCFRRPWMVAARSLAAGGPSTGPQHISIPLPWIFCFILLRRSFSCLAVCRWEPPHVSSFHGVGSSLLGCIPFRSFLFPFQAFLTPPGRPPFRWDTPGRNPPWGEVDHHRHRRKPIQFAPPTPSTRETVRIDVRLGWMRARTEGEEAKLTWRRGRSPSALEDRRRTREAAATPC